MEIASNKGVIADASTPAGRAGMSESEWREAIKFDSTDTGWVIMSIGMAIGAGIVFLPVQVGLMGLWVFLLSSVIGYPAMYLFQRLFINTLASALKRWNWRWNSGRLKASFWCQTVIIRWDLLCRTRANGPFSLSLSVMIL